MIRILGSAIIILGSAACGDHAATSVDASTDAAPDAAPAALPDFRFKWVGAFPSYATAELTNVTANLILGETGGGIFSPLEVGGGDSWETYVFTPTVAIQPCTSTVRGGALANADADLQALLPNTVITSLDFTSDSYAASAILPGTLPTNNGSIIGPVPAAELAAFVAKQATHHVVITALAQNGTALEIVGYSFAPDPAVYETMVLDADATTLGSQAAALAGGGYIITAMGRTGATSYALVGTRVQGATAPHSVMTLARETSSVPDALTQGYAIVGMFFDGATGHAILEK